MNIWKLTGIGLGAGLIVAIGIQAASAEATPDRRSLRAAGPCDSQPKMQAAVRDLNAAWDSLNEAIPDKGGHRAAAMSLVKTTIGEVQAGCMAGGG
jgi:hypothetical protein